MVVVLPGTPLTGTWSRKTCVGIGLGGAAGCASAPTASNNPAAAATEKARIMLALPESDETDACTSVARGRQCAIGPRTTVTSPSFSIEKYRSAGVSSCGGCCTTMTVRPLRATAGTIAGATGPTGPAYGLMDEYWFCMYSAGAAEPALRTSVPNAMAEVRTARAKVYGMNVLRRSDASIR